MPYHVGEKGSYGCSGYPVIKTDSSDVMGCHDSAEKARAQISAIEANEKVSIKDPEEWPTKRAETDSDGMGSRMGQPHPASTRRSIFRKPRTGQNRSGGDTGAGGGAISAADMPDGDWASVERSKKQPWSKSRINEGDFVMGQTTEGLVHGVVEHIMWEGGVYGEPGTEYAIESTPENPAMAVRVYEQDMDEDCVPTAYSIGMRYSDATVEDMEEHSMEDMEYMSKADTYTPNDGMKSAARTAIKWKEDGKAKGAGTAVGWGRARDIVAGRSMSLSVVKRMYSFFSRHEVDKKGKGFNPGTEGYPSKGRVMWNAWGGDAGFAWSRAIVRRNEDKALFHNFAKDYTRSESLTGLFKSISVGSMVSWNSSGGTARGKITRIIRSGSYKVPGSSVTLNASEDDPVAVIRLYRNGEPTETTVAHKLSSLRG
jgi:hypothetical protein